MSKDFFTAVEERRSIYSIGKNVDLAEDKIRGIVGTCNNTCTNSF